MQLLILVQHEGMLELVQGEETDDDLCFTIVIPEPEALAA
jgi:hypothetical protein